MRKRGGTGRGPSACLSARYTRIETANDIINFFFSAG